MQIDGIRVLGQIVGDPGTHHATRTDDTDNDLIAHDNLPWKLRTTEKRKRNESGPLLVFISRPIRTASHTTDV